MTYDEILAYAASLPNAHYDKPFEGDFDSTALRHTDTKKWFGLIMRVSPERVGGQPGESIWILNLKCEPEAGFTLREMYRGILPAYHMNKLHWVTVLPTSDVPEDLLRELIYTSYTLTTKRHAKA